MSESEVNQLRGSSILLCSAVRGGYSPSFKQAERALEAWCQTQDIHFDTREVVEAPIDAARDVLAAAYLAAKTPQGAPFTHCLMVDAGVGFKVETIQKLLLAREDFTAVAVPLRRTNLEAIATRGEVRCGSAFAVKLTQQTRETGKPKFAIKGGTPFMEIDGIGAALICLRAPVLLRMFEAYPELQYKAGFAYFLPTLMDDRGQSHVGLMRQAILAMRREDDPVTRARIAEEALSVDPGTFDRIGEDIAFCNRWRALDTPDKPAQIWMLADAPVMHEGHGYFVGNFSDQLD
jgi:hypothetical protein